MILTTAVAWAAGDCAGDAASEGDPAVQPIEEVLADHTQEWMSIAGVVGTGIGTCEGDPCIVVYVAERTSEIAEAIPQEVEGHRVRLEETGEFRPRDAVRSG